MTNYPNFDALSVKATQTGAMEDLDALFGAAFALPEWQFIARGELPNVNPYIASHPNYADNQPMIRAFTDGKRLLRFAAENNLTKPDGSCESLTIPTQNIVEYLERFIPLGIHGIWFNSDTESEGFFIPLKQLRPIREHLAKLEQQKKTAPEQSVETLQFVVKEGLMLPSAQVIPAPYTTNFFWRVPSNWVENREIKAEHLRKIEPELSGGRSENIEGAFYVVMDYSTIFFDSEAVKTTKWSGIVHDDDNLYFFFIASEDGEIKKVSAEEFQADVEASFQAPVKSAEQQYSEKSNQSQTSPKKPAVETLIVQIKDGLGFPSGFVKEADYTCHIFCRVPEYWIEDEQLKTEYLEKIYEKFYGANWRSGNSDGSHYVVRDAYTKIFPLEMIKNVQWSGTVNDEKNHYWWYIASLDGEVRSVKEEEFGADIKSSLQVDETDEAGSGQDDLANFGMSPSPDGEFDPNLNINQVGAVNFETSIRPFYQAIVPLLENYKGAGEYVTLLAFDPNGMSELVENIMENSHGAYLQARRFVYLNPKNNVHIGVNSIHSRHLRHVQTNAELLVSFELCKNLDNQTAAFYFRFEGMKSEVFKLMAVTQPILQQYGFEAVSQQ